MLTKELTTADRVQPRFIEQCTCVRCASCQTAFDVKPAALIKAAKKLELEGVIAKRKGSPYEPGRRSGAWVKYKINRSQEFVIGGYTAGILLMRSSWAATRTASSATFRK